MGFFLFYYKIIRTLVVEKEHSNIILWKLVTRIIA